MNRLSNLRLLRSFSIWNSLSRSVACLDSMKLSSQSIEQPNGMSSGESSASRFDSDNSSRKTPIESLRKIYECFGCGAQLQSQNELGEGFITIDKLTFMSKRELRYELCMRCETVNTTGKMLHVETQPFDYDRFIMDKICKEKRARVILLVDLLDMPNSIHEGWSKLIDRSSKASSTKVSPSAVEENEPKKTRYAKFNQKQHEQKPNEIEIGIVGNKFDLLPNTGPAFMKWVLECLIKSCASKGIKGDQIKFAEVVSAKTGYNVEKVISYIFKFWNNSARSANIYLLGMTNAGKSVFFNQLLSSDLCRPLASNAMLRATTSFWPSTTLHALKFPIAQLNDYKMRQRINRIFQDRELMDTVDKHRVKLYAKTNDLRHAEYIGIVGNTFKPHSIVDNEIKEQMSSTYELNDQTGKIVEAENYKSSSDVEQEVVDMARAKYNPELFETNEKQTAWFYDTPGILMPNHELVRLFSKQEIQLMTPTNVIMPRVYYMKPGQTLFVSGLIRIDLLESTGDELVLFSIMASPALPIVNPFSTCDADNKYKELYEKGSVLRVPYSKHIRESTLPELKSKEFEIDCIGNHLATTDIVFSCFGWTAVTSRPNIRAKVRAFTLGAHGLEQRTPSLLPAIVNLRQRWQRKDGSQSFKTIYYSKPPSI